MHKIIALIACTVFIALLTGCAALNNLTPNHPTEPTAINAEMGQPFTLSVGQTARIGLLRVTFVRVLEDSRCPIDVVCVWQGNAKVQLALTRLGQPGRRVSLNSTLNPTEIDFKGFRVSFVDIQPAPVSNHPIARRTYQVTLRVTSAEK